MIDQIVPGTVATSEAFGDPPQARLFPGEEAAVHRAVDKRRKEFTTTRHCARRALAQLGLPPVAILRGENREPRWPAGVVGSLTHCDGYRAAALARSDDLVSLGIDAEPHLPLQEELPAMITRPEERPLLAELAAQVPDVHWDRLTFSAKESVFKAWFPLARRWLGFEDASLVIDPGTRAFTVELHVPGPLVDGRPLTRMTGRWLIQNGLIVTSVSIMHASGPEHRSRS